MDLRTNCLSLIDVFLNKFIKCNVVHPIAVELVLDLTNETGGDHPDTRMVRAKFSTAMKGGNFHINKLL